MSRGTTESKVLQKNLQDQIDRLVQQLADLEESKDDLEDEYEEMKSETIEQLKEVRESLQKMVKGDVSLVDDVNAMQIAIQAAISDAFKTPEVIRLFAKKEPGQLRTRLSGIERDFKIGKLVKDDYIQQKVEILTAVKKLGDTLTTEEQMFLSQNSSTSLSNFQNVDDSSEATQVLAAAGNEIRSQKH
ncbi:protein LZIC [Ciona intestinalis]